MWYNEHNKLCSAPCGHDDIGERERIIMKATLEYILLTQSPALFLAAIVLLIGYFIKKKNHRIRAALNLIVAIVCLAGGIALYFVGMKLLDGFTIDNFWQIRIPGWVGLGVVVVLTGLSVYRSTAKAITKRRAEKYAAKAEAEHAKALEDAKTAAYESGKADALAAEKVADTVAEVAAAPAADPSPVPGASATDSEAAGEQ